MSELEYYRFPDCDCKFKIIGDPPLPKCDLPALELDWDNIPLDCKATYDLISTGKTKMCFQLEKGAGRSGASKLKPENIEHMSALGAILRPGASSNLDQDGISTTKHFYLRKNGLEEVKPYHPVIDKILEDTYSCLIYQEQSIKIAEAVAGFNKQEADNLRKAMGKKLPEEMAKVKKWFIDGAKRLGIITESQAEEVFGWIQESQRYSFNKAHSLCYGITAYQCAYAKTHSPLHAYTSWLRYAQDKGKPLEEYAELVDDAKIMGIEIYPPNIIDLKLYFDTDGEIINYGISNVKNVAEKTGLNIIKIIEEAEKDFKPIKEWSWYEFLVLAGYDIKKNAMESLIKVGAFRKMDSFRSKMLEEYEAICEVNKTEFTVLKNRYKEWDNIADAIEGIAKPKKEGGACHNKNRIEKLLSRVDLLRNPIIAYCDNAGEIANNESELLGISITCSIADVKPGEKWNGYCKDCLSENTPRTIILKVKVEEVKEYTPKKCKNEEDVGKPMAFLKVSDSTCSLSDITCFPKDWENYKNILTPGRVVEIQLEKSYRGNRFHIKSVWII